VNPLWLDLSVVLALHEEQLAEHGGATGLRLGGALESALARPRNRASYGEADIPALAAAYGFGISRNHPFIDGNKRVSLVVTEVFLELNGFILTASDEELVETWFELSAGRLSEAELAVWLRARV